MLGKTIMILEQLVDQDEINILDLFGPDPTEEGAKAVTSAANRSMDEMAAVINNTDKRVVLAPHLYAQLINAATEVAREHGVFNTQSVRAKMESAINKFVKPNHKV